MWAEDLPLSIRVKGLSLVGGYNLHHSYVCRKVTASEAENALKLIKFAMWTQTMAGYIACPMFYTCLTNVLMHLLTLRSR